MTSNQALQASIDALALQVQSLSSRKDNARPSNGKSHPANEHCKGIGHTWWKGKRDAQIPTANLAQIPNPNTGVTTNVFALNGSLGEDTKRMIEEQIQEKAWVVCETETCLFRLYPAHEHRWWLVKRWSDVQSRRNRDRGYKDLNEWDGQCCEVGKSPPLPRYLGKPDFGQPS